MKTKKLFIIIVLFLSIFVPSVMYAAENQDLGSIAGNVVDFGMNMYQFFRAVCMMASAGMFLGAILKYLKHRKNPIIAKLSDVAAMIAISAALLLLAFIPVSFK